MNYQLKYYIKKFVRFALHVFWIFPVKKNRIIFESFAGTRVNDNPYAIYLRLLKEIPNSDFIWSVKKNFIAGKDFKGRICRHHSLLSIFYFLTAKICIFNSGTPSWIPFKKNQIVIETWHGGGAYKKVGFEDKNFAGSSGIKKSCKLSAKSLGYYLSSSSFFTKIMSESYCVSEEKFLPIGMPRNDIFFDKNLSEKIRKETRSKLNINQDDFVILFAPTYRGSSVSPNFASQLDIKKIKKCCEEKFNKKAVLLFRGHYILYQKISVSNVDLNVSSYPNTQELLCAADMLITDYSSTMWDFSFTEKPGFLFVPDLASYNSNRGLYTSITTWPYDYAETNDGLCELIKNWHQENQIKKNNVHHELLGNYENGHATEKICKIIESHIRNSNS